MLAPGDRFEGFVVQAALGRGGNATVFRARPDDRPGRPVALKVLDGAHREPADLDRLGREFAVADRLRHPNIVPVYRHGPVWLSMELLTGGTIATLPTVARRVTALLQVAQALDFVHRNGVVHCDVKPSNILLHSDAPDADAMLTDFGVAHTSSETPVAQRRRVETSLPYAAPELLRGEPPTAAVDEYALACTTVEVLTGTPPFAAGTSFGLVDAHLRRPPPRRAHQIAWLPNAFDSIVAKAMAKKAAERYPTCTEFVSLVAHALR